MLVRFWGQGVKDQGHSRQEPKKPDECNIFVTVKANFGKIRSSPGLEIYCLGFRVNRSKVKVTVGAATHNRRRQLVALPASSIFLLNDVLQAMTSKMRITWRVGTNKDFKRNMAAVLMCTTYELNYSHA